MLDLSSIAVDPELAKEGTWMAYRGGRFLLARPGPEYNAALVRAYQDNKELIDSGTPEGEAKAQEIHDRLFATHVLKGWENIADRGKALDYTPELGFKVVSDLRQKALVDAMNIYVATEGNYQRADELVAEEVKSSADS